VTEPILVELTKQAGAIVSTLVWPTVILVIVIQFRSSIERFFARVTELIFKGAGLEVSAKIAQIGASIGAAEATKNVTAEASVEHPPKARVDTSTIQTTLRQVSSPKASEKLRSSNVLWVDDKPSNNFYEMASLKHLGIAIDEARSTQEAESYLNRRQYDLIITDLKRGSDPDAGLNLLKSILARTPNQRVIVYTGYSSEAKKAKVLEAGARGMTNSPTELFQLVVAQLE
jgi:CheY-like chemotaxis protein